MVGCERGQIVSPEGEQGPAAIFRHLKFQLKHNKVQSPHQGQYEREVSLVWANKARNLVERLLGVLLNTIQQWDQFQAAERDLGFFEDLDFDNNGHPTRTKMSLLNPRKKFEKLKRVHRQLYRAKEDCVGLCNEVHGSPFHHTQVMRKRGTNNDQPSRSEKNRTGP